MTQVNPNNYPGVTVAIVGYVAGPAQKPAYDKDGSTGVLEISIPVNEGYKKGNDFIQTGTTWYRYSAFGDYAKELTKLGKGDKVRIDNCKQEVREYEDKTGATVKAIELRYGTLTILESKGGSSDGFTPDAAGGGF